MAEMARQVAQTSRQIDQASRQIDQASRQIDQASRQVERTSQEVERTSRELHAFKDEMREAAARSEREMREFKDEMRLSRVEMNKKWGELSNKLGTMAEDLVAPSVPRILRETVGCPDDQLEVMHVRTVKRSPLDRGRVQEFDVVAACGEYALINETKSSLQPEDVAKFAKLLENVREYFPEFADKKVIGAIASLYVDPSLVTCGERYGLIVLGFGDDVMQVLNSADFKPKVF
jgi:hypothetical protein